MNKTLLSQDSEDTEGMLQRYKAENKTIFINSFPKQQFFGENYEYENWMKKTSKFNNKSYNIETIKI